MKAVHANGPRFVVRRPVETIRIFYLFFGVVPISSISHVSERRHDLDWIRVGAFALLILYHVGMFYVPWDWHVNSPRPIPALEPIMTLVNPWRLTLLFLVSGCAMRFLADSIFRAGQGAAGLAGSRIVRLLPPLLFAVFLVVPPQSYYEVLEYMRGAFPDVSDEASHPFIADFWVRYATASGNWCDGEGCLITPTWNHMWFVAYLLVYSLVLTALLAFPAVRSGLNDASRLFAGLGLVVWPLMWLVSIRLLLAPRFEITHTLIDDWYNHALSFGAFLFGYVIARSDDIRLRLISLRWPALVLAMISYTLLASYHWIYTEASPPESLRQLMRAVYAVDQASFIAAILGFGAKWLNHGGPILRYLSLGVFPFYIIHQTAIVVAAHHLAKLGWSQMLEALVVIAITGIACALTYEVARRTGWFGVFLGVKTPGENTRHF